jgi:hypothetical protein
VFPLKKRLLISAWVYCSVLGQGPSPSLISQPSAISNQSARSWAWPDTQRQNHCLPPSSSALPSRHPTPSSRRRQQVKISGIKVRPGDPPRPQTKPSSSSAPPSLSPCLAQIFSSPPQHTSPLLSHHTHSTERVCAPRHLLCLASTR